MDFAIPVENAARGSWYFKETEEDGVVVKVNGSRARNKANHITENIVAVKPAKENGKECAGKVEITFKNDQVRSGHSSLVFDSESFDSESNDFSEKFGGMTSAKDFCDALKRLIAPIFNEDDSALISPSTSAATLDITDDEESAPKVKSQKKSKKPAKRKLSLKDVDIKDLHSPQKRKTRTSNEDILGHRLGSFYVPVETLDDCKEEWLDRPLDRPYVAKLVKVMEDDATAMSNMQPWLAIADVSVKDFTSKAMIKGCKLEIIGGRHRMYTFKELLMNTTDRATKQICSKVWVNVYDNTLTDEEVRRLAAQHNTQNVGSRRTKWFERVVSCRKRLYSMAGTEFETDEVPGGNTTWKKTCQFAYTHGETDVNSLEPTLQAALLTKAVWDVLCRVVAMYERGDVKDMKKDKRNRRIKEREIKQHQIGMPLQGLSAESKLKLLQQVECKESSLEEMQKAAKNMKSKKAVVKAFLQFVGERDVDALERRFPNHITEEKLAQFKNLKFKAGSLPVELENFFKRAIAWEKEEDNVLKLSTEKNGVYFFESGESADMGILFEGSISEFSATVVKEKVNGCLGFQLVLIRLEENADANMLKLFLIKLHALNLERMTSYTVVVFLHAAEQLEWASTVMVAKMTTCQQAFWVDTTPKPPKGHVLQNSLFDMLICHWYTNDAVLEQTCCHENGSNVYLAQKDEKEIPTELCAQLCKNYSFVNSWVLDLTNSKGNAAIGCIGSKRNCTALVCKSNLRATAESMNESLTEKRNEKDSDLDDELMI